MTSPRLAAWTIGLAALAVAGCRSGPWLIPAPVSASILGEPQVEWGSIPAVHLREGAAIVLSNAGSDTGTQLVTDLAPLWRAVDANHRANRTLYVDRVVIRFGNRTDTGTDFCDLQVTIFGRWAGGQTVEFESDWMIMKPHLGWTETTESPKFSTTFSELLTRALLQALTGTGSKERSKYLN